MKKTGIEQPTWRDHVPFADQEDEDLYLGTSLLLAVVTKDAPRAAHCLSHGADPDMNIQGSDFIAEKKGDNPAVRAAIADTSPTALTAARFERNIQSFVRSVENEYDNPKVSKGDIRLFGAKLAQEGYACIASLNDGSRDAQKLSKFKATSEQFFTISGSKKEDFYPHYAAALKDIQEPPPINVETTLASLPPTAHIHALLQQNFYTDTDPNPPIALLRAEMEKKDRAAEEAKMKELDRISALPAASRGAEMDRRKDYREDTQVKQSLEKAQDLVTLQLAVALKSNDPGGIDHALSMGADMFHPITDLLAERDEVLTDGRDSQYKHLQSELKQSRVRNAGEVITTPPLHLEVKDTLEKNKDSMDTLRLLLSNEAFLQEENSIYYLLDAYDQAMNPSDGEPLLYDHELVQEFEQLFKSAINKDFINIPYVKEVGTLKEEITPLRKAIEIGSETMVKILIEAGADINQKCQSEGKYITPLECAMKAKKYDIADQLLRYPNTSVSRDTLIYGMESKNFELVSKMLEHYEIKTDEDMLDITRLALQYGSPEIVQSLIPRIAQSIASDPTIAQKLLESAFKNDTEMKQFVMSEQFIGMAFPGKSLHEVIDKETHSKLFYEMLRINDTEMAQSLITEDQTLSKAQLETILKLGSKETIELLINNGLLNTKLCPDFAGQDDTFHQFVLDTVVTHNPDSDVLKKLLEDPTYSKHVNEPYEVTNRAGSPITKYPLETAMKADSPDKVMLLLQNGATPGKNTLGDYLKNEGRVFPQKCLTMVKIFMDNGHLDQKGLEALIKQSSKMRPLQQELQKINEGIQREQERKIPEPVPEAPEKPRRREDQQPQEAQLTPRSEALAQFLEQGSAHTMSLNDLGSQRPTKPPPAPQAAPPANSATPPREERAKEGRMQGILEAAPDLQTILDPLASIKSVKIGGNTTAPDAPHPPTKPGPAGPGRPL